MLTMIFLDSTQENFKQSSLMCTRYRVHYITLCISYFKCLLKCMLFGPTFLQLAVKQDAVILYSTFISDAP